MHIRLLAVGDRQPQWVDEAVGIYSERFPREWKFRLDIVSTARRGKNASPNRALESESEALLSRLSVTEQVVLLDERGAQLTSRQLAGKLSDWQGEGRDLSFIIGGPDGVADACHQRANFIWSLSKLTLPHGLARALLSEQLYRAWSLQTAHPYHRD